MVGSGILDAPPTTTFTYTSDGGLSSDGTWTYAYDAEDQLVSVTSSALTNGAIRILNSYDYRHRRTSKTVQRLNSTIPLPPAPPTGTQEWETVETRTFVYDDWNLIHETVYTVESGVTNVTEIQYFWGRDLSGTIQGAGGVGGLLAVSRNGQLYFPAYDNNGNVTKYIDESGNVVAAYEYDDFGRTISQSGPLADFFRHRFSTKYYDPETGLYYYGYRYYKPRIMCWLTEDPIGDSGGANLYAFCGNSVTVLFDKLGRFPSSTRQCSKNGVVISFVFDGKTLSGGSFSTTAASGRPQKTNTPLTLVTDKFGRIIGTRVTYNYEFDYSKERQKIRDVGPTPEGTYYILVNEKRTKWNSVRTHILRHAGWGDYGWSLHPEPNTETYGRSGFFIHGGSEWGSAGCIDLTNGDEKLSRFLEGLCNCYIPVVVKYVVDRNTISETYTDMSPE
jgi:RHS repeat-associated protein